MKRITSIVLSGIVAIVAMMTWPTISLGSLKNKTDPFGGKTVEDQQKETEAIYQKFFNHLLAQLEQYPSPSPMLGLRPLLIGTELRLYGQKVNHRGEVHEELVGLLTSQELTATNTDAKADALAEGVKVFYENNNHPEALATVGMFVAKSDTTDAINQRLMDLAQVTTSPEKDKLIARGNITGFGTKFLNIDKQEHVVLTMLIDEGGARNEYFVDQIKTKYFDKLSDKDLEKILKEFFRKAAVLVEKIL